MPVQISHVPLAEIEHVLPQILPQIRRALIYFRGDTVTEPDLLAALSHGALELVAVRDGEKLLGGLVLEIDRREASRIALTVVLVAGRNSRAWGADAQAWLRDYAKQIGAHVVHAWCRPGLVRLLPPGWRCKSVVMELVT